MIRDRFVTIAKVVGLLTLGFIGLSIFLAQSPTPNVTKMADTSGNSPATTSSNPNSLTSQSGITEGMPDEVRADFWAKVYLWGISIGLIVTAIGVAATFQQKHYADKVSAYQKVQIAQAQDRAAQAQLQLAKIVTPRVLSGNDASALIRRLVQFRGQPFVITTYWDMKEAMGIAEALFEVLEGSQWTYLKPPAGTSLFAGIEGIQVWIHPKASEPAKAAATALVAALNDVRLTAVEKDENAANPVEDKIGITVGAKPLLSDVR